MSDEQGGAGGDVGEQGVHEQNGQVIFEIGPVGRVSHGRPDGMGAFDDDVCKPSRGPEFAREVFSWQFRTMFDAGSRWLRSSIFRGRDRCPCLP